MSTLYEVTEWFPGALTEVTYTTDDKSHAWDVAFMSARNFAAHMGAKVDTASLESEPGMYAHAKVKRDGVIIAEYAVQEA